MLGAIAGDIIGSPFEHRPHRSVTFPLFSRESCFTDDTVLTVALADSILHNHPPAGKLKEYARKYPNAGYGGRFMKWAASASDAPYNSLGNGSAMRVSAVGYAYDSLPEVLRQAKACAEVTHNHPEGIKGAQAMAAAIFLARTGTSKADILRYIERTFYYDLQRTPDDIRPAYRFDVTCSGSVPESIVAFLHSTDYESAVRLAVSMGGDSDTMACMAGAIAEAFYQGVPDHIGQEVFRLLDHHLTGVVKRFIERFPVVRATPAAP